MFDLLNVFEMVHFQRGNAICNLLANRSSQVTPFLLNTDPSRLAKELTSFGTESNIDT